MNVSLTRQLEQFVNLKVESGLYHSASEVIRDGLRLLKERDQLRELELARLREEIAIGARQIKRGQFRTYTPKTLHRLFDRIRTKGSKKVFRNHQNSR